MKREMGLAIVLLVALMGQVLAQDQESSMDFPIDDETGKVTYEEVVKVKDVSKDNLYKRADAWFQSYFTNPGGVIEKKEDGKGIWGQDRFFLWDKEDGQKRRAGLVKYDIDVQVKDGRYKYKITEIFKQQSPRLFINQWMTDEGKYKEEYKDYLKQIHEKMDELISDLKDTMDQSLADDDDDDW